jgi:hypothetical protein
MAATITTYETKVSKDGLKALMRDKNVPFLSNDNKQALIQKCLAGGVDIPGLTMVPLSTRAEQSTTGRSATQVSSGTTNISTTSNRSFHGILELIRSRSTITHPKEIALDRISEIIEHDDFLVKSLGDYREEIKILYEKAIQLIKQGKAIYGNDVPAIAILFGFFEQQSSSNDYQKF